MIVLALAPGRMRLTSLHRLLPGVSTGVLERYLQQMAALDLITRTRFKEMPPRVELELTDAGRDLLPIASMLARWGMRHRWSEPTGHERIDVGALLRLLPELLGERAALPGDATLAALVENAAKPIGVLYRVQDARLQIVSDAEDEATIASATASARGDERAWIAALGPHADFTGLRFAGEAQLAKHVLGALPRELGPGLSQ